MLEFTLPTEPTRDCLSLANRATSTRPAKPVLANVRLSSSASVALVEATDLEIAFSGEIAGAICNGDGAVLLPAARLCAIVSRIHGESFSIHETTKGVKIAADSCEFTLPTAPLADWPARLGLSRNVVWKCTLPGNALAVAIRRGAPAIGESTRYAIGGAALGLSQVGCDVMTTDSHVCILTPVKASDVIPDAQTLVVPERAVGFLRVLCGDNPISLASDGNSLTASSGSWQMSCRLLEGRFPTKGVRENVEMSRDGSAIEVSVGQLTEALERVVLVASENDRGITWNFADGEIAFSASTELGSAKARIPIGREVVRRAFLDARLVIPFLKTLDPASTLTIGVGKDNPDITTLATADGTRFAVMGLSKE